MVHSYMDQIVNALDRLEQQLRHLFKKLFINYFPGQIRRRFTTGPTYSAGKSTNQTFSRLTSIAIMNNNFNNASHSYHNHTEITL